MPQTNRNIELKGLGTMHDEQHIHHEINYVELTVLDLADAKRFYSLAFGWKFNDYGPDYVGIRKQQGEGEAGGICRGTTISRGGPLVILFSRDLEATLVAVQNAGGTISKEIISFPGGRRFQFCDPSGNELGVWSDREPT